MRRGYDRAGYLRRVEALRREVAGVELSTDVIVGFPGETEQDFEQTLSLLDEVRFATVYGFVYSARPGTEAETFTDQVPMDDGDRRLQQVLERQKEIQQSVNHGWLGREVKVMIDGPSKRDPRDWTGRTPENRIVNFCAPHRSPGELVALRISEASAYSLRGVPVP
jgi:tRNA-2-methylthio-N6-dimethylallyladenosine synthase